MREREQRERGGGCVLFLYVPSTVLCLLSSHPGFLKSSTPFFTSSLSCKYTFCHLLSTETGLTPRHLHLPQTNTHVSSLTFAHLRCISTVTTLTHQFLPSTGCGGIQLTYFPSLSLSCSVFFQLTRTCLKLQHSFQVISVATRCQRPSRQ